jgi:hypothetical protein
MRSRFASLLKRCAAAFIVATGACETIVNEVRVEPSSTPRVPVFVLTDTSGNAPSSLIYGFSVVRCGSDSAAWTIAADGSQAHPPRLTYGETPPGYQTRVGPEPLRPGCYVVFVTGARRTRFRIDANGKVVADSPPPRREPSPPR